MIFVLKFIPNRMVRSLFLVSFFSFVVCVFGLAGCTSTPSKPVYFQDLVNKTQYYVRPGDTLYAIGRRSGHGYKRLAQWNNISSPYRLKINQKIKLFKPKQRVRLTKKTPLRKKKQKKKRISSQKTSTISNNNKKMLKLLWQWPVKGKIIQSFSKSGNQGIDINAKLGQKVKAAAAGKVVYSGDGLKGYGNLLIVKHNAQYLSAYANNRRLLVKEGHKVKKGQVIAEVGRGRGKRASLHFEIRSYGKPVNPLLYLPKK